MIPPSVLPDVPEWAAAHVKSRCEKALVEFLEKRGVKHFLPLARRRRVYGARVRESSIPLFPGYVFFDRAGIAYHAVFDSRKVARVLYADDAAGLRNDLGRIAQILEAGVELREVKPPEPGQRVAIVAGPLKGLEAEMVRRSGKTTLVVRIEFLSKAAELEIDESFARPL
jgi:transcription antitermination factor NusG